MIEARRLCEAENIPFSYAFRYQYAISRRPLDLPGMDQRRFAGMVVHTGAKLPVSELRDRQGRPVGLLLGLAVAPEGLLGANHVIPGLDGCADAPLDHFEDWLVDLTGRYTIILDLAGERRVYCDPVGMNGVVYNPHLRRIAASPLLCIDRPVLPNPLFDHDLMAREGGRLSLFQTRDRDVVRMNPNFYLDLDNFHETRHWPRNERFHHDGWEHASVLDEIIRIARHNIGALVNGHQCSLPLSGGRDSRLILALAGGHAKKIRQVFTHVTNFSTGVDAEIATRLAEIAGVPHEIHPAQRPERLRKTVAHIREARAYQIASGVLTPPPDEIRTQVHRHLAEGSVVLRGHQTDLLRAVYVPWADKRKWKDFNWQIRKLLIVPIERFDAEIAARFRPLYMQWLRTLPRNALEKQPDFMFLEIFYANSLGTAFPALPRAFYLSPFNSRKLISLSLGFDDAYRIAGHPVDDIIARINPSLTSIRYTREHPDETGALMQTEARRQATMARHEAMFGNWKRLKRA